jgi:hypothetical protein
MHAKKPRRSPLRLRFLTYLLEEISYAICITYFPTIPYEQKLIRTSYLVTVAVNAIMMILFPAGFLKLHSVIGWIFTAIVYTVLLAACCFISYRTTLLFKIIAKKEEDLKTVLDEIQSLSDRLFHSRISTIFHF